MIHCLLPAVIFLAYVVLTERKDRQVTKARDAHATEVALLNLTLRDRLDASHTAHRVHVAALVEAHREDVQILCQRIQAPSLAVVEHQQREAEEGGAHPPTDAEIAAQQEMASVISDLERIEAENASLLS